jgi:hypothetical protein
MASFSQTAHKTYLPFRGVKNDPALYSALDPTTRQIRYVDLHPGSRTDPVVCSLGYAILGPDSNDKLAYEALSYCWGSVDDVVGITLHVPDMDQVQGTTLCDDFQVTRNLEEALRALRFTSEARRLWVDAICINQMNDKEKTHQVGQMNLIYSSAQQVVVWLGLEDNHSSIVFRYYELFKHEIQASSPQQHLAPPRLLPVYSPQLDRLVRSLSRTMLQDSYMKDALLLSPRKEDLPISTDSSPRSEIHQLFGCSVNDLLDRPWFHRIWVYPEVYLAPQDEYGNRLVTIGIGARIMRWPDFVQIVRAAQTIPRRWSKIGRSSRENVYWFLEAWDFEYKAYARKTLDQCVYQTRDFLASDPRDKIFALLHIAEDTRDCIHTNPRLLPNYERSIFDFVLNYVSVGILLVSNLRIARPDAREHNSPEFNLDFGFKGRALFGIDHPLKGDRLACVERFLGHESKNRSKRPKGCRNTFAATDGRLYAVNCFLAPKDEILTSPNATTPFVITPCPGSANAYLLRGACVCYPLSNKDGRAPATKPRTYRQFIDYPGTTITTQRVSFYQPLHDTTLPGHSDCT